MVAEWIALRHELKQQGSCYRRNTLQQAFEALQTEGTSTTAAKSQSKAKVAQADQKALWRDLLNALDLRLAEQIDAPPSPLQPQSQPAVQPFCNDGYSK